MQSRGEGCRSAQKKSPEACASGPHVNAQIHPLRQLQVQEDPHNEREQRQCLHEYQTQQHGGANASSRSGITCDALTRSGSDASLPQSAADRRYGDSETGDRKSTRLNSSHANISYAVFCLKKKKKSRERAISPNPSISSNSPPPPSR